MPPNTSEGKEGKKGHLLNCFCFCSHSFQTDTPEFMYWVLTFHFFLCMNTLTGNKCLFPHLLHCWHTRKHNLCIFKRSYFQLISTSLFVWLLSSSKFWACVIFWSISGKSAVGIFLSEKWELIHSRQISGYSILIRSSR